MSGPKGGIPKAPRINIWNVNGSGQMRDYTRVRRFAPNTAIRLDS
jgi:hypothetical protein